MVQHSGRGLGVAILYVVCRQLDMGDPTTY